MMFPGGEDCQELKLSGACFYDLQQHNCGVVTRTNRLSPAKRAYRVRRERRWSTAGVNPPGNWFAPPGSNQSSSGGNETAEASGAEGREGDSASIQAIT